MPGFSAGEHVSTEKTTAPRIAALKKRHASLETAIDDENSRPLPDDAAVAHLKREKLAIKDELERLAHS